MLMSDIKPLNSTIFSFLFIYFVQKTYNLNFIRENGFGWPWILIGPKQALI